MEVRMEAYTNNANKYTIAYENSMSNINGKNDKNTWAFQCVRALAG